MSDTEAGIIALERTSIAEFLTDEGKRSEFFERVKRETDKLEPDLTTDKGRKAIASMAHKVAKTKVAIDTEGKALTETARKQIDAINGARKIVRDELDELKEQVRKPLTEWEAAEALREEKALEQINFLSSASTVGLSETVEQVETRRDEVKQLEISADLHGDQVEQIEQIRNAAAEALDNSIKQMRDAIAEKEELERLRAANEKLEQEKKEREEAEAEAERQRIADEEEAERIKAAEEKAREEERQRIEKEAAEEKQREAARLEKEAEEREAAEAERIEELQEQARKEERERIEAEAAANAPAPTPSPSGAGQNITAFADILKEAKESMMQATDLDEETCRTVIRAIARDQVKHCSIVKPD